MNGPAFEHLVTIEVPARGPSLWTLAHPYVAAPVKLKFEVDTQARWTRSCGECGAGGHCKPTADAILLTAPLGALVGKIGGSDADCPVPINPPVGSPAPVPDAPRIFAVGAYCVIDAKQGGPLFLTMNDAVDAFANHEGALVVRISAARVY